MHILILFQCNSLLLFTISSKVSCFLLEVLYNATNKLVFIFFTKAGMYCSNENGLLCHFTCVFKSISHTFELLVSIVKPNLTFFPFRASFISNIYARQHIQFIRDGIFLLCTSLLLQFPTFPKPLSIERTLRRFTLQLLFLYAKKFLHEFVRQDFAINVRKD